VRNQFECELRDRLSSLVFSSPLRVDHATVLATIKDKPAVALKSAILERRCARWLRARTGRGGRINSVEQMDGT
jgi:hypothetical protein